MELITGGAYQGKFDYAAEKYKFGNDEVFFPEKKDLRLLEGKRVIYGFHSLVWLWLKKGLNPQAETEKISAEVIIVDEIGSGIVPIGDFERRWREETGRCCCILAKKADRVTRVFSGIPTVIK